MWSIRRRWITRLPGHDHAQNTPYLRKPITQEPEITGNTGNSGNGLAGRAFQALPPNKRSGNRWQHKLVFEYKTALLTTALVITVASKNHWQQNTDFGNGWKPRITGLLPLLPLLPVFLKLEKHVYECFSCGCAA